MMNIVNEFNVYKKSIGDRTSLYKIIAQNFQVKRALYPGSHIDIMASFVISDVIYIDNFKETIKFFKEMDAILRLIENNKTYEVNPQIVFFEGDYRNSFDIEPVDLIISQFAGFVGQDTKHYLKDGGILLCNDSHGDATLAYCDGDYEFIGIVNSMNVIETENLNIYFQFSRKRPIDIEKVRTTMKGPNYKVKADNYLFKKNRRSVLCG